MAATDASWSKPTAPAAGAAPATPPFHEGQPEGGSSARKAELAALGIEAAGCTRCRLAQGRTQVVFGVGNPDADLVFVGEAPGFHEDQQGYPFVGAAGKLLDKLLDGIGMTRQDVYIANVLKCRPPGNRDPMPDEIEACETYLFRQLSLIQPRLVATLGNFATKLLSGKQHGITRVHGQPQPVQVGGLPVVLYPLYHPAAALYTPAMLRTLEEDFARLPQLLAEKDAPAVAVTETLELDADVIPFPQATPQPVAAMVASDEQLELF